MASIGDLTVKLRVDTSELDEALARISKRTVWVDDDGDYASGTVINAAVMNNIEDRIDAAHARIGAFQRQNLSIVAAAVGVGLALVSSPRKVSRRALFGLGWLRTKAGA